MRFVPGGTWLAGLTGASLRRRGLPVWPDELAGVTEPAILEFLFLFRGVMINYMCSKKCFHTFLAWLISR